ncbi:MAG: class I SAM-dependent methyltransferase [Limnobacter sp.]|uniref:class I SAM-dependent methyltransferase n=1 Tax=Limnobacter sp. TaxID=2003368 RepID=UPI00391C9C0A
MSDNDTKAKGLECAVCHGGFLKHWESRDAKSGDGLPLGFCSQCGLVQQLELPSDEALRVYYSHHYRQDYKSTYAPKAKYVWRAGVTARDRLAFMQRAGLNPSGLRLLDVGAGGGEFCYVAAQAGFASQGIEPNEGYSDFARKAYDVDIRTCNLDDVGGDRFDVITLFHVFEHLAHPERSLEKLWTMLADGGRLVIEVPNIEQADASPHNIYFKAHLFYYSRHSLIAAASRFFEVAYVEDTGNLSVCFTKRVAPLPCKEMPSEADVQATLKRLTDKGWLEYLFVGGGVYKPFKRVAKAVREARMKRMAPREILDNAIDKVDRNDRLVANVVMGALAIAALEACT